MADERTRIDQAWPVAAVIHLDLISRVGREVRGRVEDRLMAIDADAGSWFQ